MTKLRNYTASQRNSIYQDLLAGRPPGVGAYDESALKEGRTKGAAQLGTTRYKPQSIAFEFIFPAPQGASTILTVEIEAPERIIFLPVPNWVIENIWQGSIEGSYCFESEIPELLDAFQQELEPGTNAKHFGPQPAKRRE